MINEYSKTCSQVAYLLLLPLTYGVAASAVKCHLLIEQTVMELFLLQKQFLSEGIKKILPCILRAT
jgi:hypothetical protein